MKSVGFINFPTESILNTGEGGSIIRLVVIDPKNNYIPCIGGYNSFFLEEEFLGDDLLQKSDNHEENLKKLKICENKYFPELNSEEESIHDGVFRYLSSHFLTIITLGATDWSNSNWICKFDDLNIEGKNLYFSLQQLYPECEIRLLTFLDT